MTMDLTPSQITSATFRTVRRGYDPDEVDELLAEVAAALERAQQQATAMEARARAAVARLQEQAAGAAAPSDASPSERHLTADEAESISRTLLLAQQTADRAVSEARSEAERILAEARSRADETLDSTREMSAKMMEEARAEARSLTESERLNAGEEVERLRARREFLLGDVSELEAFLVDQRDRLRSAARQIEALVERVPDGLGAMPAPALSASADDRTTSPRATDDERTNDEQEAAASAPELPGRRSFFAPADEPGAEVRLPPEAQMPFANATDLAMVLDSATFPFDQPDEHGNPSDDPRHLDTGELDVTQTMPRPVVPIDHVPNDHTPG